jgi:GTP-binding protein
VPIAFITGQAGKNVKALLNHSQMLFKQSLSRVNTGELNRLVRAALELHPPPMFGSTTPKIYYATQVSAQPPTLVLMCNQPRAFSPTYRRYLLGVLRDQLNFGEVPLKLYLKRRRNSDQRDDVAVAPVRPSTNDEPGDYDEQLDSELESSDEANQ